MIKNVFMFSLSMLPVPIAGRLLNANVQLQNAFRERFDLFEGFQIFQIQK